MSSVAYFHSSSFNFSLHQFQLSALALSKHAWENCMWLVRICFLTLYLYSQCMSWSYHLTDLCIGRTIIIVYNWYSKTSFISAF